MKVLLMVERDGRVVCVRRWNAEPDLSSFHWAVYLWAVYLEGRTYWLVEAPDAEMARMVINSAPCDDPRILASGGRK